MYQTKISIQSFGEDNDNLLIFMTLKPGLNKKFLKISLIKNRYVVKIFRFLPKLLKNKT